MMPMFRDPYAKCVISTGITRRILHLANANKNFRHLLATDDFNLQPIAEVLDHARLDENNIILNGSAEWCGNHSDHLSEKLIAAVSPAQPRTGSARGARS